MTINEIFKKFPSEDDLMDIIMHTSTAVWKKELVKEDINMWLSNFKGEVLSLQQERLLALWLLTHFTFYNENEVRHLCKVIFKDLIHKIIENNRSVPVKEAIEKFFEKSNIISPEKISGSGGFIAYFFRHENQLPMTLFNFSLDNVNNDIDNIIVIDDVTLTSGSGGQMDSFWKKAKAKYPNKNFYLLTLVSSESSYTYLKSKYNIEIITAIKLDDRDKCFHIESNVFASYKGLTSVGEKFAEHYGNKIGVTHPLGYHNGQYTFGFFYNTPDNTLPIFWGQVNSWVPILRRYHKNYGSKTYLHDERFI